MGRLLAAFPGAADAARRLWLFRGALWGAAPQPSRRALQAPHAVGIRASAAPSGTAGSGRAGCAPDGRLHPAGIAPLPGAPRAPAPSPSALTCARSRPGSTPRAAPISWKGPGPCRAAYCDAPSRPSTSSCRARRQDRARAPVPHKLAHSLLRLVGRRCKAGADDVLDRAVGGAPEPVGGAPKTRLAKPPRCRVCAPCAPRPCPPSSGRGTRRPYGRRRTRAARRLALVYPAAARRGGARRSGRGAAQAPVWTARNKNRAPTP